MKTATARNTMGGTRPRNADDCYLTPQPLADAICRRLREVIGPVSLIVEPSAGARAFVRAARTAWGEVMTYAIEPNPPQPTELCRECRRFCCFCLDDDATWEAWEPPDYFPPPGTLVVGNPPYLLAEPHVRIALDRLGHGAAKEPQPRWLAFLLRASFLAGDKRARGLHLGTGGLRHVWHVVGRPSFTGDGKTDGAEYAVCVWQAGWRGPYEGGWLTWRGEAA